MATVRQITTFEQVKEHLTLIQHTQPAIITFFDEKSVLNIAKFDYDPRQLQEIILVTTPLYIPKGTEIYVKYIFDGSEHYFKSELISYIVHRTILKCF
jgi:hypothetical protein